MPKRKEYGIAYKVVEKNTRNCTNWAAIKDYAKYWDGKISSIAIATKQRYPHYFPRYLKGKIVSAAPQSVGICIFLKKEHAQSFQNRHVAENTKIIKVKCLSKPKRLHRIVFFCYRNPYRIVNGERDYLSPTGTYGVNAVEVLE